MIGTSGKFDIFEINAPTAAGLVQQTRFANEFRKYGFME